MSKGRGSKRRGQRKRGHVWRPPRRVVAIGDGTEVGYCMEPTRPDDCLRTAVATATQIPIEQVPDLRLDARLNAGEDAEEISRSSWERIVLWLYDRGFELAMHADVPLDRDRWIGVVAAPTDPASREAFEAEAAALGHELSGSPFTDHCLVMTYDQVLFDPAVSLPAPPGMRVRGFQASDVDYGLSIDPKE